VRAVDSRSRSAGSGGGGAGDEGLIAARRRDGTCHLLRGMRPEDDDEDGGDGDDDDGEERLGKGGYWDGVSMGGGRDMDGR